MYFYIIIGSPRLKWSGKLVNRSSGRLCIAILSMNVLENRKKLEYNSGHPLKLDRSRPNLLLVAFSTIKRHSSRSTLVRIACLLQLIDYRTISKNRLIIMHAKNRRVYA